MGSQINRALSRTDRRRRLSSQQQKQAKQYVKFFNCSMIAILIFGDAFMTSHSTQAHQGCFQHMLIAAVSSVIMNLTSPQLMLICGWLMVMAQTLFFSDRISLLFNIGTFLTLYAIFTNIYNYFAFIHPIHNFLKNLVPSVLMIMGGLIYQFGHCSSHLAKQIRAQQNKIDIYQQHGLGIRIVFNILGVMVIIMCLISHIYIRNRRFIPIGISHQLAYIKSLGVLTLIQLFLFVVGLRALMLNIKLTKQCNSGVSIVINLTITAALIGLFSLGVYTYISKNNIARDSNKFINMLTLGLIWAYSVSQWLGLSSYLSYPLYLSLITMIVTHTTNLIQNQLNVNYAITFIVAIICQTNKLQHSHQLNQQDKLINVGVYVCCLTLAVVSPIICKYLKSKIYKTQSIQHSNPESSELISPNY